MKLSLSPAVALVDGFDLGAPVAALRASAREVLLGRKLVIFVLRMWRLA